MMHNPAHPGELLGGWIEDVGYSVTGFAQHIGVSRVMLSRILHGHAGISADMDLRLSEALGTTPGFWLRMQAAHDLWQAQQRAVARPVVTRIAPPETVTA
ncbi:MAG: HigA family addiction module antitoxin [Burkholderiaceae bacterium]|jgi:addiction module HigA family antidote|nr:HigA family addiction module antidote protein [Burkholderiaceae bacterium]